MNTITPRNIATCLCLAVLVGAAGGCATPEDPVFFESTKPAQTQPSGQTLVHILRTPTFVDSANNWIVGLNGQYLVTVPNGRYYMFTNQPGTLKFTTRFKVNALNWGLGSLFFNKGREVLKLDAKADTTYYLKLYLGQMTQLSYENGKAALAKCTKIIDTPPPLARTNNVISKT